jgi:hypothetical protein
MNELAPIAFVDDEGDIRVNFGMFAGREATQAEIDELARTLFGDDAPVTIVAEQRTIAGPDSEASVHQIRVELDGRSPDAALAAVRDWAQSCIAERHIEIEEV